MISGQESKPMTAAEFFLKMPKVEIHVHLEGATSSKTIWEMAQRNGVKLPAETESEWRQFFDYRDFEHFVQVYCAGTAAMLTLDDWSLMIDRFMQEQARQNIIYSEVFISASHHLDRHNWADWISVMKDALEAGKEKYGVSAALIPDISREMPATQGRVLEFVLQAQKAGIAIGIGLGGVEADFPPSMFVETYKEARANGLHSLVHAGETAGPDSIRQAIDLLGAERIGHGVRVLESEELIQELAESKIPFEVNPTSNYCIGVTSKDAPHPIHEMNRRGLQVTVNSDDPAMFNTSLTSEYELLHKQGMSIDELVKLAARGIKSTFAPDFVKETQLQQLRQFELSFSVN